MSEPNPKAEAFFANATHWRDELRALRAILRRCPVVEDFKWRSPVYTAHGGNVATVGGLRRACVLSFFKGVLLADPKGLLVAPGENTRSGRLLEFTSTAQIASHAATIRAYVREAAENEKEGRTVVFEKDDLAMPDELAAALAADPALKRAFEALTPGRRRGYLLHVSQAKQPATRSARVEKHAPRILDGKGMHDR